MKYIEPMMKAQKDDETRPENNTQLLAFDRDSQIIPEEKEQMEIV